MKIKADRKKDGQVKLEVSLERDEFKPYFEQTLNKAFKEVEIKGFRKGQAPKETAIKYIDQEKVFQEAAERAIKMSIKKVSEENDWIIITPPQVILKEDREGLSYEAEFTTFPDIKLGDYKKIAQKLNLELEEKLKKIEVSEKDVEGAVEWLIKSREEINPKKNEEGKEGDKIKDLTDEMAQKIGNFQTARELKESIREGIKIEKKEREVDYNRAKILEEIIQNSQIEPPQVMVNKMTQNMKEDLKRSLENGKISYNEYVEKHYQSENKLEEALKLKAVKEIKAHLALDQIFKEEGLKVDDAEVEEEMNRVFMNQSGVNKDNINWQQLRDWSYGKIKNKKVFEKLEELK